MRRRWVLACTVAEAIGMTAAAAAARLGTWLADTARGGAAVVLLVIVLGGAVEGTALGTLQARTLRGRTGRRAARRWAVVTVMVAGVGWAAASVPAAMSGDDGRTEPPLALVLVGAAALGAVMGAALGLAQAGAVRHDVRRPWRWVLASTVGWTAAMPVIFLGATTPTASWSATTVVLLGCATGAAAGAVLGLLTARSADRLVRTHPSVRV